MILLDTHVWVWWATDPDRLTPVLARRLDAEDRVGLSPVSCWELGMLLDKQRLRLTVDALTFLRQSQRDLGIEILALSAEAAIRAAAFGDHLHRDPADRFIVATAIERRIPLATADARLLAFADVQTIW